MERIYFLLLVTFVISITRTSSSPIMVDFGTKGGPIEPPTSTTTTELPRDQWREPAPVYENQDDTPNQIPYKPLTPQEYKKQIFKNKPNHNLILGTPLDRKYSTTLQKYSQQKMVKPYGLEYRGPQTFVVQEYEKDLRKNEYVQQVEQKSNSAEVNTNVDAQNKYVPEIGIVYSAGVRYYVPQIVYYGYDDIDNSVYEANDYKYYYNNHKNYNHY